MSPSRRSVLAASALGLGMATVARAGRPTSNAARFSLKFAPHDGSFVSRGDVIEQIAFAADQGFTAWEDNEAVSRPPAQIDAMAKALRQRGMTMGVLVASMPKWSQFRPLLGADDGAEREAMLADLGPAIEVAKRLDAKWLTVVTGFMDPKVPIDLQTARIIELMRRAGDVAAQHNVVLVMEPLNTITNHPNIFMRTIPQGYMIAKGANSPGVKVLADLYHAQIQAGNLIPTLQSCWDEIGYIQFGDNPGRLEPGTGEINYKTIVGWLRKRGYAGVIGMEHGNSLDGRAGEDRLIAAYREIDAA
ncbi:hydroxypyruvate isomerase family protein [Hephaestia mangrovi]|uniref:hydroxypyruvate isomerase family protein n=1 Tax=Hephaestia mangrovi TaxID=2873268 RepID=UPI001CA6B9DE|nr:TIM barrel protein [Hephaestia mangrovi]MBY8827359.1 TIM barrel protein [Hephaestia mangrovi]